MMKKPVAILLPTSSNGDHDPDPTAPGWVGRSILITVQVTPGAPEDEIDEANRILGDALQNLVNVHSNIESASTMSRARLGDFVGNVARIVRGK